MKSNQKSEILSSIGQEVITLSELEELFKNKEEIICYDGFEPSNLMHCAQALMKMIYVNKMVDAGCTVVFWIADYFAMLNGKMKET